MGLKGTDLALSLNIRHLTRCRPPFHLEPWALSFHWVKPGPMGDILVARLLKASLSQIQEPKLAPELSSMLELETW